MAKAAPQGNMMVYMVAVPYGADGQQQPQQWMTDHSQYGNQFGGQQVMVAPMQPDTRGGQTMPVPMQSQDQSGANPWSTGTWQTMPQQDQQWAGGWTDQSQGGGMPQQSQQQDQQPWTNPMAGNPSGMNPSRQEFVPSGGQQQQQPQQFNPMQQQQQFHMQQPQQFFVPQQFQQGNIQQHQQQLQQQTPQQMSQQQTQQPQFSTQQQINPTESQNTQGGMSTNSTASALAARPKKRGLVNKAIEKVANPAEETPKESVPQVPVAPVSAVPSPTPASTSPTPTSAPAEQRVRKGLTNKPISKDIALGAPAPKEPEEAGAEPPKRKGLMNKPITKDGALSAVDPPKKEAASDEAPTSSSSTAVAAAPTPAAPAPAPPPAPEKTPLDMKTIAAWEPVRANDNENKSMIKALGLEPVNPTRPKPRPAAPDKPRPNEDQISELKKFAAEQSKPRLRLTNRTLTPSGGIKEKPEEPVKPADLPIVDETPTSAQRSSPSAPSHMVESSPKESKDPTPKAGGSVLLGRADFSRSIMLQFWKAAKGQLPMSDLNYKTAPRDDDACSPSAMWTVPRKSSLPQDQISWRRTGKKTPQGKDNSSKDRMEDLSNKAANPYKKKMPTSREEALQKEVRGLLNKICPENKERIIEKLGQIKVDNAEELEIVISIIFHKVTDDPHHCETYVDMVRNMSQIYAEKKFPAEEGQTLDFRRMLVNQCQNKFEDLLQCTDNLVEKPPDMEQEEYDDLVIRQKRNAMATMKFIGYLYLRKLIAAAVIRQVVKELLNGTQENPDSPPELQVEYALELITATGHEFDKTEKDKVQLNVFFARLSDLKKYKTPDGKPCLSKRIQFQIQDLMDMRAGGWAKSKHKEVAKTMAEVAREQEREEREAALAGGKNARGGKGKGRY
mmetsp:Transcript_101648/g.160737  ORF Transcript_101648/g.160737 Transcript_101648/m.160737 type:complete len:897 (+) Transcript_101648:177-2867(+)